MGDDSLTVASEVSFSELCGCVEKISKTQGNDKKKKMLHNFMEKWREFHEDIHKENKDTVIYNNYSFEKPYFFDILFDLPILIAPVVYRASTCKSHTVIHVSYRNLMNAVNPVVTCINVISDKDSMDFEN